MYTTHCSFNATTTFCFSEIFAKYRDGQYFEQIVYIMKDKYKKHSKDIFPFYCLAAIIDHRINLVGVVGALETIYENIQLPIGNKIEENKVLIRSTFDIYLNHNMVVVHPLLQQLLLPLLPLAPKENIWH